MIGNNNYNPDVLSCLANLSSDEVFTPPNIANQILDSLPSDLWNDPNLTFLDPVSKSGVFLREIVKRLVKGLEDKIPNKSERINHILSNQVYGIAITELTALISRRTIYCSKMANGNYSIINEVFSSEEGNIFFSEVSHTWSKDEKCIFCNANRSNYERNSSLETHAYNFIHTHKPEDIFNMKFDVIIGNPPYHLSDGGHGRSASPIYHRFVEQALKLNPRFLSMIIPARWYAGGKGLDDFRSKMLSDKHIRKIVDFEHSNEAFQGVDISGGVCYFLRDRETPGPCEFVNYSKGSSNKSTRYLDEFNVLIRHNQAISILKKVNLLKINNGKKLSDRVSPRKPFGLETDYKPKKSGVPCWFTQKIGKRFADISDVSDSFKYLKQWKLLVPPWPIAGQTDFSKPIGFYSNSNVRIAEPGECCTEAYIVAAAFDTKEEVESFKSYLFTKIVRFLILQTVTSQHVTREKFIFVPDLKEYKQEFTDDLLIEEWGITDSEWKFIDSKIKQIS